MAFDAATDRRIQRMSCQKVAIEAMAPFPVTSKGEPAAAAEKWKESFIALCDFLSDDVNNAGGEVAVVSEPATIPQNGKGDEQTLEEALELADRVKQKSAGNDVLKNAIKLQIVKFGVKSPKSLEDALTKLTKTQAAELEEYIDKEVD